MRSPSFGEGTALLKGLPLFERLQEGMRGLLKPRPAPPERFELELDGLKVLVLRKSIRRLRLVLLPDGRPRLSMPKRCSQRAALEFLGEQLPWIRRQQSRLAAEPAKGPASPEEKAAWRRQLAERIPALLERWEQKLGVKAKRWGLRDMRSRWGSCNPRTASLSFSLRLAAYPPECLDYIVLHELLHLLEPGHGPRFKALLKENAPAWKAAHRVLNGKTFALQIF